MKRNLIVSTLLVLSFVASTFAYGCIQDFTQTSVWELHPNQAVGQYISGSHITENTFAGAALLRGDSNPISGTFYIIPGQSNDTSSAIFSTSFSSSSQVVYANGTASLTVGNGYTFLWVRDGSGNITEIWQAGDWLSPDSFAYFDTFSDPDNAGQFCFETAPSPSATASPSSSVTPSVTPSISVSPSSSATPSISVSPSSSATPSVTPSISVSPSSSVTPSVSVTPSSSATPSVTPSISVSPSSSVTPSSSATPSVTPSISVSPSSSATPSVTPSISVTPSRSATPSVTPSISVSPSSSATPSVTPSISVSPSRSPSPSATPSPAVNSAPLHTLKSTTYSTVNSTFFNSTQTLIRANTGLQPGYLMSFSVNDPDCTYGNSPLSLYINVTTTQTGGYIAYLEISSSFSTSGLNITISPDQTSLTMYGTQSDINALGQQLKIKWNNNLLSFLVFFSINDNGYSGYCPGAPGTTCALWTASQTTYKTVTVV